LLKYIQIYGGHKVPKNTDQILHKYYTTKIITAYSKMAEVTSASMVLPINYRLLSERYAHHIYSSFPLNFLITYCQSEVP